MAADWPGSCRAGRKAAGCHRRIGTSQGCAGRAHLGAEQKRGQGSFRYVIINRFLRPEMNEGETMCVYHAPESSLGFLVVDSDWLG